MPQDRPKHVPVFFIPAAQACREASWHPKADIYRTPDGWILKFDLAGVCPEDVTIEICGSTLTVAGARRDWVQTEGWSYYSMEISYSRFARRIQMPIHLEGAHIESEYRDGMFLLRVRIKGDER